MKHVAQNRGPLIVQAAKDMFESGINLDNIFVDDGDENKITPQMLEKNGIAAGKPIVQRNVCRALCEDNGLPCCWCGDCWLLSF